MATDKQLRLILKVEYVVTAIVAFHQSLCSLETNGRIEC